MRQSFIGFLILPSLFALAWLLTAAPNTSAPIATANALPADLGFASTIALLLGGALTVGFVASMQGLRDRARAAGHAPLGVAIAVIFRFAIGLPVIACMLYWAMRAAGAS